MKEGESEPGGHPEEERDRRGMSTRKGPGAGAASVRSRKQADSQWCENKCSRGQVVGNKVRGLG